MDPFHSVHNIDRKPSKWIHVVRGGAIDRSSSNIQARLPMARGLVKDVKKKTLNKKKNGIGLL